jgi:hypothetical protein
MGVATNPAQVIEEHRRKIKKLGALKGAMGIWLPGVCLNQWTFDPFFCGAASDSMLLIDNCIATVGRTPQT